MICEVREDGGKQEVALHNPTWGDVLAMIRLIVEPDKEIVFTRPEELPG